MRAVIGGKNTAFCPFPVPCFVAQRAMPPVPTLHNEVRHRTVFASGIAPFLNTEDRRCVRAVCRGWRTWLPSVTGTEAAEPRRVPLTDDQTEAICRSLRDLRLPWSEATEGYLCKHLQREPCVRADGADLPGLLQYLTRCYRRATLPPKTNIGTLVRAARAYRPTCAPVRRRYHPGDRATHPGPPQSIPHRSGGHGATVRFAPPAARGPQACNRPQTWTPCCIRRRVRGGRR